MCKSIGAEPSYIDEQYCLLAIFYFISEEFESLVSEVFFFIWLKSIYLKTFSYSGLYFTHSLYSLQPHHNKTLEGIF